jgi:octanoyl-[GcvH]:protein N-octanoyltransferase
LLTAALAALDLKLGQPVFGRRVVQTGLTNCSPPAVSVALDDALAESVGAGVSPATIRVWENRRAVVVPRWRLRRRATGTVTDLHGREWPLCPRSSGGTAVAHGPGTLNLSLILPGRSHSRPSIEDGYRLWIAILSSALRAAVGVAVSASSVEGAFCSGDYDAVVAGRKMGGTAQSRRNGAIVIHGTILTHVDAAAYLRIVAQADRLCDIRRPSDAYKADRVVSLHDLGGPVAAEELACAIIHAATIESGDAADRLVAPAELTRATEIAARYGANRGSYGATDAPMREDGIGAGGCSPSDEFAEIGLRA